MSSHVPSVPSALVELRILDGANLYFPRPAVKLTLDLTRLLEMDEEAVRAAAEQMGMRGARPGGAGTGLRQRFAARLVARLVRRVAAESGTTRLAVRSRPTGDLRRIVVAYPWRRRGRAEALGLAVAAVLDAVPAPDLTTVLADAVESVRAAEPGDVPTTRRPRVPLVAVTGTNGKTTTSRMVARMGRCAGLVVGWSSTDGVYIDGELVEPGDYSGPSGAAAVLDDPRVQLAVTETARGGILLRGLGVTHTDVSVVTNVSADHLGLQGVDTVDQLAEVKAVITRVIRPDGWVVLNGDDPRTFAMRLAASARAVVFSRDPDSPSIRQVLNEGGRAVTVIDGAITFLGRSHPDALLPVVDVPMTLAGLSHFNVENALAATAAGLSVGLSARGGDRGTAVVPARAGGQPRADERVRPARRDRRPRPRAQRGRGGGAGRGAARVARTRRDRPAGAGQPGGPDRRHHPRHRRAGRPRRRPGGHRAQGVLPARPSGGGAGRVCWSRVRPRWACTTYRSIRPSSRPCRRWSPSRHPGTWWG